MPEVVVRELFANALIHQDFEIGGASPVVEVFANRVEISNAGEPIVPVHRFQKPLPLAQQADDEPVPARAVRPASRS